MPSQIDLNIKRIAVVSHNYNLLNRYGHHDFAEHVVQINRICDAEGCDTILYSLFTWDENSPVQRDYATLFGELKNIKCIFLEVGNKKSAQKTVEIWLKDEDKPRLIQQKFAKSSEPPKFKWEFIRDINKRVIGNGIRVPLFQFPSNNLRLDEDAIIRRLEEGLRIQ